jgi:hypothetical protein
MRRTTRLAAFVYLAARVGYSSANASGKVEILETTAGFRPNRLQLIKLSYEYGHYSTGTQQTDNTLAIQFSTTLHRSVGNK